MPTSLNDTQTISEIADLMYRFLPGKPHPYADQSISFHGVAQKLGLSQYWTGGSKKPALTHLLLAILDERRNQFCNLIIEIVKTGIVYLSIKREPVTREEILKLNKLIMKVNFKIPELWDPEFLDQLSSKPATGDKTDNILDQRTKEILKQSLIDMAKLEAHKRGYEFEKFLNGMFAYYELEPRNSFRLIGEQIDGSFQLYSDTYLVEAKWQDEQIGQGDLLILHGKVEGKSIWSRGLFVSYSGFSPDGLVAFSKGRATNMIGMDSQDLFHILNGEMSLSEAIKQKARRAAETGEFYVSVYLLSHGG